MKYRFKAISPKGDLIEDIYDSSSEDKVLEMIKSRKLLALSIEEETKIDLRSLFTVKKVGKKDLVIFCKLFHTMLNAGTSISHSLGIIAENTSNIRLKTALIDIKNDIYKGSALSDAIEKQNKIFPSIFYEMVRAGEISGNLDVIINRLENYYDKQYKIENKVKSSIVYPALIIVLSIFVIIFMLTFVFPIFNDVFSTREMNLPLPTKLLFFISNGIRYNWTKLIFIFTIAIVLIFGYLKTEKGELILDYLKLNIPLAKGLYTNVVTANFTKTLSLLISSGIPLLISLNMSSTVLNNQIIKKKLENEIVHIEMGKSLSDSIRDLGIFPSVVHSMIKVGEETGALDELLLKTSLYYDEEVSTSFEKVTKLIEPVLMIVIGFIVGFIVLSLALPMFDAMYTI